jgi:CD63 antigen
MNCGMECIKYLLFIFNFIFALGGLAILVCGVLIRVALSSIVEVTQESELNSVHISLPASVLIAVGAVIFIIAFFGCCGAIRESHCMIVTFAVLLLTLLIVQVAVAAYGFVTLRGVDVETALKKELQKSYNEFYTVKPRQDAINSLQTLAHCCGYTSYRDFLNANQSDQKIPYSCCKKEESQSCSIDEVRDVKGCGDEIFPLVKYYANALGGLALGIAAIELIGIIFSFCLANSIRNVERRGYKV